jgi:hypothetical protein
MMVGNIKIFSARGGSGLGIEVGEFAKELEGKAKVIRISAKETEINLFIL